MNMLNPRIRSASDYEAARPSKDEAEAAARTLLLWAGGEPTGIGAVDLTAIPGAGVGSRVQLWGEELSVDEVAASARTVSYELLCALSPRVPVTIRAQ